MRLPPFALLLALAPLVAGAETYDLVLEDVELDVRHAPSVFDGSSLGGGRDALYATIGYPELSVGLSHGLSDAVDLGGELSFELDREWSEAAGSLRYQLLTAGPFQLAGRGRVGGFYASGTRSFSRRNREDYGLLLGVGLLTGLELAPRSIATAGLELPLALGFKQGALHVPLLAALGYDYAFPQQRVSVGVGVTGGPWLVSDPHHSIFHWTLALRATYAL